VSRGVTLYIGPDASVIDLEIGAVQRDSDVWPVASLCSPSLPPTFEFETAARRGDGVIDLSARLGKAYVDGSIPPLGSILIF
jgi:hypothetical protein